MKALVGPNDHLRNHVQHLLQTHELYLIQWESRLNNAVALRGKALCIVIASVDLKIMQAFILLLGVLA